MFTCTRSAHVILWRARSLNPQWLSDALKCVVTMRANAEIRKGVMSYSTLQKCWKAYTYAERIQLLELLKLFELGFAVDDSHLLLPCLLEHHPPADMPVPAAAALHLCKRFLFTCLPPDLFPRLISRTHRFTLSGVGGTLHSCWATGCWLQKAGHLGRISLDMHNPRKVYIDIDVWGREPFNFYSILCECLEALLWEPSYEGLQTSRQIGCPKCAAGAVFFTEESLEKRIDQGRFRFECITCDSQLDARELLGRALFRPDATPVLLCKRSCMSIGDLSLSRGVRRLHLTSNPSWMRCSKVRKSFNRLRKIKLTQHPSCNPNISNDCNDICSRW